MELDNPALGIIAYHFRFCRIWSITCDANRDGQIDARFRVESEDNRVGSTGFTVKDGWESLDRDGIMNIHYYYTDEGTARVLRLEVDSDKDGEFEEILAGEQAECRLRSLEVIPLVP
ncbi:MAG: hypothetical protein HC882_09960 [Acidobacteria bacterium]|nr:hypothetical protein [Acidobacteriota bacterium]